MFVSKKIKEERLDTCKKCDFYRNFLMLKKPKLTWGARGGKCKCFLDAKTTLTKEFLGECPLNKWKE